MIKLTYTEEMQVQDKLWETESENLEIMQECYGQIIEEAKEKGFQGIVDHYILGNEVVFEIYESKEHYDAAVLGKADSSDMGGYCKPLIEKLEYLLNQ